MAKYKIMMRIVLTDKATHIEKMMMAMEPEAMKWELHDEYGEEFDTKSEAEEYVENDRKMVERSMTGGTKLEFKVEEIKE